MTDGISSRTGRIAGHAADSGGAECPSQRFQILSLDGGGLRGVFTAAILAAIEEDCGVSVIDSFDLIAGTSTGGILALGLGLGLSPKDMVQFYVDCGPKIFSYPSIRAFGPKYAAENLAAVLKEKFGERAFGASAKRLVIPSFNIGENEVYVFRTAHLERLRRDYKVPAWHVGMATAAAPTYFPAHRLPDRTRLIDGGVWANNPSMVALTEAVGQPHLAIPMDHVRLLSLGTVSAFRGRREELDDGGMWQWKTAAVSVIMDASSIGVANQAKALLGDRFCRINAQGVDKDVRLDDTRSIDGLIAAAQHVSRSHMPVIADRFMKHNAAPFTPYYTP